MGYLLGLCPPPEELTLGNWLKEFGGVLPSQVKDIEDWRFLAAYHSLKHLMSSYRDWNTMVSKPELKMSMPSDLIDWMLDLIKEAQQEYGKED